MEIINYELFKLGENVTITVGSIIFLLFGIVIARILNSVVRRVLKAFFNKRSVDVGRSYTILTLVKYFIYAVVFITIINVIGIKLNYLLAGSAALLVGIGIGLQGTFNDFFSGIILLIDGTIEVGDVLQVNDQIGRVKFIGLRTSKIETLDAHIIIFPNSQLVNNQVNNLTHKQSPIRLSVDIGVSYGSDIRQVENTLLEVVKQFSKFKMNYTPSVFLVSYGDSSINFKLYFFSSEVFRSDKIRSDVRKAIWIAFKREGIQIPFPQRDVWIKNADK
jgi:small-conductance mechanosensitive channel